ncbi:MAG: AMP-binding protein, partial [Spirochaetia bacterium]|nr:AMP-binding protein [Spirochaetia bacterium]
MLLIEKFVNRTEFSSYEDFFNNYKLNVPENFNFTYDVMDVLAAETPDALAMLWIDDRGNRKDFTFAQMKENVDKTASYFKSLGIGKGDMVMLILQRRYEWWFSMLALHKIGAICIPATHMLTAEDIVFRCNAAKIKMIVAVDENDVPVHVEKAMAESPTVKHLVIVNAEREGWESFDKGVAAAAPFDGPRVTENSDVSLIYFTSGTTSHPKMVAHDYLYPLAHIVTAY